MIDFLIISGIKKQTIDKIKEESLNVYDLSINKEECIKIITYLKIIGLKNIDEILLNNIGLFLKTKDEIVELFSKQDINHLVNLINENVSNIDILFE